MPGSLLIVDDYAPMRETLRDMMRPLFDTIREAASGEEAVRLNEMHPHNAILMDIVMPGMDGIEATARIMATHRNTAVFILTSYDEPRYRAKAEQAGACGFFLKDDLGKVREAICDALSRMPAGGG